MTGSQGQTAAGVREWLQGGKLAGSWTLDGARSEIRLHTKHTWVAPLTGVFREVTGNGSVSADGTVSGTLVVAAASVDTKHERRDTHLRSAAFFDAASHPDFTFAVESVTPAGDGVRVVGTLTIRGYARSVVFDAQVSAADDEVRLTAEVPINRADYGMTWNMLGIAAMNSNIVIRAVFTRA